MLERRRRYLFGHLGLDYAVKMKARPHGPLPQEREKLSHSMENSLSRACAPSPRSSAPSPGGEGWGEGGRYLPPRGFVLLLLLTLAVAPGHSQGLGAQTTHGMVASVHPLATEAGLNILKHGGNAVDATIAVALTLGVVDTDNSGIGGGCFMLIRLANSSLVAI